jgi:hypothetical protein
MSSAHTARSVGAGYEATELSKKIPQAGKLVRRSDDVLELTTFKVGHELLCILHVSEGRRVRTLVTRSVHLKLRDWEIYVENVE